MPWWKSIMSELCRSLSRTKRWLSPLILVTYEDGFVNTVTYPDEGGLMTVAMGEPHGP